MSLNSTLQKFEQGVISKPDYIRDMYVKHHDKLFEYSEYLSRTDISAIEIMDNAVIMVSRGSRVKMICPRGDHRVAPIEILNFFDYEKSDSEMIMNLVGDAENILDIGANMGWYSINIAKAYPDSMIYAFEPIPKTFEYLTRNVSINKVSNINIYPFGFSNEEKDIYFYYYPEGSGNASSANVSEREDAQIIKSNVRVVDDFAEKEGVTVDFIKCDVEGAELLVFEGALKTIERDRPIIFSEILRKWSAKFNYHPNKIINMLSDMGYRCFCANKENLIEVKEITDNTIETNFFFLHDVKHKNKIDNLLI